MDNNNGESKLGRRRTLQLLGMGITATGLLGLAAACGKSSGPAGGGGGGGGGGSAALDCYTPLDDNSKNLRRTLQYKDVALVPEKNCANCAQFEAGKYAECGGCKLIPGPVKPQGGCLSFAPKGGEAGTPT